MLGNPFSYGAVDDVEAPLALDNQLKDVLIEGQHFWVDLGVSNILLDGIEALFVDVICMCKLDKVFPNIISAHNAWAVLINMYWGFWNRGFALLMMVDSVLQVQYKYYHLNMTYGI